MIVLLAGVIRSGGALNPVGALIVTEVRARIEPHTCHTQGGLS
jgi:hypothetical protein